MSQPQILILEDLGIPKTDFEYFAMEAKMPFKFAWSKDDLEPKDSIAGIVTVKTKIDSQLLSDYPNVKFIAVAFTGYDCVDLELCRQKNIAVFNAPAYSTNSVAELSLGLAISLLREIPKANNLIRSGQWNLPQAGNELSGKTIGILGTGTIGLKTAELFQAFGCKIVAWSRSKKQEFESLGGQYLADLKEFFSTADIISIHLPLNADTKGLVGVKEISLMKPTAYLINTARGPIINEKELIEALKVHKIAGAAIDVFDQEPIAANNDLLELENVILTPHLAYKTVEALNRRAKITIKNIADFIAGKSSNRVD